VRGAVLLLTLLICTAGTANADLEVGDPRGHTLSTKELRQLAVRSSEVVLLGRIMVPMAPVDTLPDTIRIDGRLTHLPLPVYVARIQIEPIEYLKGGLEGDIIDARYRFGGEGPFTALAVSSLAGIDTVGAVFFLKQSGHEWWLAKITPRLPPNDGRSENPVLEQEMREGLVPLPQRKWTDTLDQVRAWIQEMPPDSLKARRSLGLNLPPGNLGLRDRQSGWVKTRTF